MNPTMVQFAGKNRGIPDTGRPANGGEYLHDAVEMVQVGSRHRRSLWADGLVALHFVLELLGGAGRRPLDAA